MNILVVDDRATNLKLVRAQLEAAGMIVHEARDGVEALAVLVHTSVDAVISDILMPRMDGYRLCSEIRRSEQWSSLPIVIYTATYTSPSDERLAFDVGADHYLRKPATAEVLLAALRKVTRPDAMQRRRKHAPLTETVVLKEYNERLVAKLEQKNTELAAALDQLQAKEERLRSIVETEPECVKVVSPEGRLLEMNPAGLAMLEAETLDQLNQQPLLDYLVPEHRAAFAEMHRRVMRGDDATLQFQVVGLKGTCRWLETHATPLHDSQGRIVSLLGITRDITTNRATETALRESEQKLRNLIDGLGPSNFVGLMTPEGILLEANRPVLVAAGLNPADVLGKPVEQSPWFSHDPAVQEQLRAAVVRAAAGETVRYDVQIRGVEDRLIWIDLSIHPIRDSGGRVVNLVPSATVIEDRKAAEEALRESRERFRQVVENIREVFWMRDVEKNRMIYISPGYEQIWGRPCAEPHGSMQSWVESILPEDRERVLHAAGTQQVSGDYDVTYRILRPDGTQRWIRDQAYPVKEADGRVRRVVGVAEDITDRKHIEEQFLHAQRMEAIGTLASGVAHDLNNILAPILMVAGLLKLRSDASDKDLEMLSIIELSGQRGADIIRQLLNFSRSKPGERGIVQPRHLLRDMTAIMRETFPRNINIVDAVPAHLWTVQADPTQLHQVVMNLCVNARDAMPAGGTLTLEAANVAGEEVFAEIKTGRQVRLTVKDTGEGIPPETIGRIFEPFFTTKESGKGTGLGLSTVVSIVRNHGGMVKVASEPGRSTTFDVYLPASTEEVVYLPEGSAPLMAVGQGELILVVDDEDSIRNLMSRTLEREGYRVLLAGSGEEAIKEFFQHQGVLRLVLTDFMMPGMDGLALIRALRLLAPSLPIIATSGMDQDKDRQELTTLGVGEIIMKPFVPMQLLKAVRSQLVPKS